MNPVSDKTNLLDLSHAQLTAWLASEGVKPFRANQILHWVYMRQTDQFDQMSNLSKPLREKLARHFHIQRLTQTTVQTAKDGTLKYLLELSDGHHIETVLIPEKDHYTLCISSQVGCGQGCTFCLTARGGFKRNLTAGEILAQIRDICNTIANPDKLTNLVLMGMGEPLTNITNVIQALQIVCNNRYGLNFSSRRVTLSTAGIVPRLEALGRAIDVGLAISLNAADNHTRNKLMPINKTYPIEMLIEALRHYPLKPRRRITIEYILIKDLNDSTSQARQLARLLRPVKVKINLIPFNEHNGCRYKTPSSDTIAAFQQILQKHQYTVMVRHSKGRDISAACGQLCPHTPRSA